MGWNYGDIYEAVADVMPEGTPALIHKQRVITWQAFEQRANNLARNFLDAPGIEYGDKVAFYLRNHSAYMETLFACFKSRLTHVNLNYRYVEDELWYILDNSDSKIIVFDAEFRQHIPALQKRLPEIVLWVQVNDENNLVDGAVSFEALTEGGGKRLQIERAGEDMMFLYTGGTTGMPKGVMWEHQNHWLAGAAGATPLTGMVPPKDIAEHAENVRKAGGGRRSFPVCPQMHGTGLFTCIGSLAQGGCIVTTDSARFAPEETWQIVENHQVSSMAIVGDAFARPLLRTLDEQPGRFDISSVLIIISSGVMWSPEVKEGLLRHNPNMALIDSFGASEAVGFGTSTTTADGGEKVARFALGEKTKVFTADFREVKPGSGEAGMVARTGGIPSGYYKDPEKTANTFPLIDGVRYSMPGDWCTVEEDGTLTLLGRGSVCINTAGEKVYPEEVEEVLKLHPDVEDALVVGVPDEKWGQAVTAVVQLNGEKELDEVSLQAHVRKSLAGYKCPKRILPIPDLGRASNGKADYKKITEFARTALGQAVL